MAYKDKNTIWHPCAQQALSAEEDFLCMHRSWEDGSFSKGMTKRNYVWSRPTSKSGCIQWNYKGRQRLETPHGLLASHSSQISELQGQKETLKKLEKTPTAVFWPPHTYVHMYLYRYTHMYKYTHMYTKKRKTKKSTSQVGSEPGSVNKGTFFFSILQTLRINKDKTNKQR